MDLLKTDFAMRKHVVTALLFVIGIAFYALGAAGPGTVFLVLGALVELAFWYRIFVLRK